MHLSTWLGQSNVVLEYSRFFVFPSTRTHETSTFKARPNSSRESGLFSFSKVFFSTNHCAARGLFCLSDPRIFTKSAAIRAFMNRFQRNSELKLLSASSFDPRGRFSVLLVRLALKIFCPFFGHFLGSVGQNANFTPRMTFDGSKHLRIDFLVVSYPFLSLEKIFKPHFFGGALFWVNLTKFNEFDLFLLILKASP